MRPAQTNFLYRVTLAKTRAMSSGPGECAEDRTRYSCFQLRLVASAALGGFPEVHLSQNFQSGPVMPTRDGHNNFTRTKLSSV
jgi:hypothetical protein